MGGWFWVSFSRATGPLLNRVWIIGFLSGWKSVQIFCRGVWFVLPKIMPLHVPLKTLPKGSMWTPLAAKKSDLQFSALIESSVSPARSWAKFPADLPVKRHW